MLQVITPWLIKQGDRFMKSQKTNTTNENNGSSDEYTLLEDNRIPNIPVATAYAAPPSVTAAFQRHQAQVGVNISEEKAKYVRYFTAKRFWTYDAIANMLVANLVAPVMSGFLISSNIKRSYAFTLTGLVVLPNIVPSILSTLQAQGESPDALIYNLPAIDGKPLYKMNACGKGFINFVLGVSALIPPLVASAMVIYRDELDSKTAKNDFAKGYFYTATYASFSAPLLLNIAFNLNHYKYKRLARQVLSDSSIPAGMTCYLNTIFAITACLSVVVAMTLKGSDYLQQHPLPILASAFGVFVIGCLLSFAIKNENSNLRKVMISYHYEDPDSGKRIHSELTTLVNPCAKNGEMQISRSKKELLQYVILTASISAIVAGACGVLSSGGVGQPIFCSGAIIATNLITQFLCNSITADNLRDTELVKNARRIDTLSLG
jgi:hypothetical protein